MMLLTACFYGSAVFGGECATCGGETDVDLGCTTCGAPALASCGEASCGEVSCCEASTTPWRQKHFCLFDVNGYVNAGGIFNTHGAQYNLNHVNSDNEMGLDGAYISMVRQAKTGCGTVDWGFGSDFMFGRDARFLSGYAGWDSDWTTGHRSSNFNNYETLDEANRAGYGFAMPQLYGEVSANYLTLKVGHFYTPMGYESARADERFFYTLGRDFEVTPITHSGALVTWDRINNVEVSGGYVIGENNTFDEEYNEHLFLGMIRAKLNPLADAKYSVLMGDGAVQGYRGHQFRQSFVLKSQLTDRLETAFVFSNGSFDATEEQAGPVSLDGNASSGYSIGGNIADLMSLCRSDNLKYMTFGGHAYYKLNECWKTGFRMEWQKGTTETANYIDESLEAIDIAVGANWNPCGNDNLVLRPELRYDRVTTLVFGKTFADSKDQLSLGGDIMYRF
ncbi:MAG: outer membrane beta-barrel protein [Planctomycetia bacterium]|nr:outer membrane beta-barrel protein [Planctomycetia bacterium]